MAAQSHLLPPQSPNVVNALKETQSRYDTTQKLWLEMCRADDGAFFPVDMVAMGAVKRSASQSYGLRLFIEGWNLLCARALLRTQIDTALRFSALWLVKAPHDVAREILRGERLDKMKDQHGKRMTDAYLISKLAPEHTWLPDVYERTSGYIHFSGAHMFSPIAEVRKIKIYLSKVVIELDSNEDLFIKQDFLTGDLNTRRELNPGQRLDFHIGPSQLAKFRQKGFKCAAAVDEIKRVYRSSEAGLQNLVNMLLKDEVSNLTLNSLTKLD